MHNFVRAKGWYDPGSSRPQTLRNLAISLSLEVSEVLEHFQWSETPEDTKELSGELADVALYLLQIASLSGIDLDQAIMDKLKSTINGPGMTANQYLLGTSKEIKIFMMIENARVTVFGGSKPKKGEIAYQDALILGTLLGQAGFTVITGGYIGTMEAVSRGASQAGGHVIGITCDEIESWRPVVPNPWINEELTLSDPEKSFIRLNKSL